MKLQTDDIQRVVLLGGGALLRKVCLWCLSEGAPISVLSTPNQSSHKTHTGILGLVLAF